MASSSYDSQGHAYHDQRWAQAMQRAVPRRFVLKAGTLAALGGSSALNALIAACAASGSQKHDVVGELAAGSFKYSRYPHIEKYNWRNLPWGGTPYVDGKMVIVKETPVNWDFTRSYKSTYTPPMMQNVLRLGFDPTGNPDFTYEIPYLELDIADKITPASDYSYYDYHIRPNTYFHDIAPVNGRLCTAEDVAYSLESLRTTGYQTAPLGIVERFEALNKETVRAIMKRPALWLNYILAGPDYAVFAREHYEGDQQRWKSQPIGTGPFMVTKAELGRGITAIRHPRYNRPVAHFAGYQLPFLREYEGLAVPDVSAQKAAFRSSQTDIYWEGAGGAGNFDDLLATNPDSIIQVSASTSTFGTIELNLKNPLFQDVRVRRALNMALNRKEMADLIYGGMASPGHPISYQFQGRTDPLTYDELDQWHQHNPSRAKELLAEAGYPNGFEMELLTSGPPSNLVVVVADYLAVIGVRVKFTQLESTVVATHRANRTYKDAIGGEGHTAYHGARQAMQQFLPDSPKNVPSIDDPVLTDLVYRAAYSLDADDQMRLLKQIYTYVMDQCLAIETLSGFQVFFMHPWLHNLGHAPSGYVLHTGSWQFGNAWMDDTAPAERRGRLKT